MQKSKKTTNRISAPSKPTSGKPASGNNSRNAPQNAPHPNTGKKPQASAPRKSAARPDAKQRPTGQKANVAITQNAPSGAKQPIPMPVKETKPRKERSEKLKPKKEKDPNRIRVLSTEGRVDIPMLIITLVLLRSG